MNKYPLTTILLFFLILPLLSTAQGWEKTYDGGLSENASAADRTLDGGVIMAGTETDNINDLDYSYLYKTDIDGNLQWEFHDTIHSGSFVNTLTVMTTSDGNFLLSSLYGNNPPNNTYVLQKIAPSGNVLWTISPNTATLPYFYATDLAESSDGGYLLLGAYDNQSSGLYSTGLLKIDINGNILWENAYPSGDLPVFPGDVIELANGDILFNGYFGFFNDDQNSFVKRLASDGTIIWENEYNNSDNDFSLELVELTSGDIVIGGQHSTDFSMTTVNLHKIDEDGNELWYQSYNSPGNQNLEGLQQTNDGGFALAGYTNSFSPGWQDFYLLKVDADGNELWLNTYGRSKHDFCSGLMLADDQGFYLAGNTQKLDDSYDAYLIKTDSLGISISNTLSGNLYNDENLNCLPDTNESGLHQWLIQAVKGDIHYVELTDPMGNYSFTLDTGTYDLTVFPISPYWGLCDTTFSINFSGTYQTLTEDIPAQILIFCPLLDVSIGTPFLRRCMENSYSVQYCNYGTITAEDAYVEVLLDPFMIVENTSIPIASQDGNLFTFNLGDVPVGECGNFSIDILLGDSTTCDSIVFGATHCVEAHIYPDSICLPNNSWSGASIEVDATCQGDSIFFFIQNVGDAPTHNSLDYIIIEDDVILLQGNFNLNPAESEVIGVPTNGATFRMEAQQEPNHPSMSMPSVTVEGCGDGNVLFSFGFVNIFAQDDGDPFVDIDCQQNIGSYDPNDKTGFPLGYDDENYISRGQDLEYLIRFQNTGTDTAFTVVIRDELSDFLNIASIRPGASSHNYDFDISEDGTLMFTFNDIMLPDSNVNEPASHGFVKFKVSQIPGLPLETKVYNTAAIYFDFNEPVLTNETLHTIGEPLLDVQVSIDPVENAPALVKVYPNPFSNFTNVEIEGMDIQNAEFKMYDATGRLLRKQNFTNNTFVLEKKDLIPGLYFFTIEESGELISSGKLMAQ